MKLNWNPPCHYDMHVWDYYLNLYKPQAIECELEKLIAKEFCNEHHTGNSSARM